MTILQAILLAIIEGVTEFLPISSTGHMIIASSMMGIASDDFTKLFTVAIQFGAILSVVVLYFRRFFRSMDFYYKLFFAFIPTGIVGLLLKDYIDSMLENVVVVAVSLLIGGIVLLMVDRWFRKNEETPADQEITYRKAFMIGVFQSLAILAPGISRSATTIVGGLAQKLTRRTAAEFSFFLAVPTMFAATAKSLYDKRELITSDTINLLLMGNLVAFIVAMIAIRAFIGFLTKYGFKIFGVYRILIGILILALYFSGYNLEIV